MAATKRHCRETSESSAAVDRADAVSSAEATRRLDEVLRVGDPPVVGRIAHDRLFLDCRTVLPAQVSLLAGALTTAAARL